MLNDPELDAYMDWLMREHGNEVDFVVLYGSRARGDCKAHSDYDLLIGLRGSSNTTYRERVIEFSRCDVHMMEAKPYTPEELAQEWFHYGRTLLDPLYEGVVVLDRGGWSAYQRRFAETMENGILEHDGPMWIWHREREPADSPRLAEDRRLQVLGWGPRFTPHISDTT